jgi:hypothetical protein
MKKIYKYLFAIAVVLPIAGNMNGASDPTFSIIGFTTASPLPETAAGTNSSISVVFDGATVVQAAGVTVDGSVYSGSILQIAKGGSITVSRPATGNDVIENVTLLCSSTSTKSVNVLCEWSTFAAPTAFTNDEWNENGKVNVVGLNLLGDAAYGLSAVEFIYGGGTTKNLIDAYNDGYIETNPGEIQSIRFTIQNDSEESLFLYGVKIYTAMTATGLSQETVIKTPLKTSYYDLTGKPVTATAKGILIQKSVYDDGTVGYGKAYVR